MKIIKYVKLDSVDGIPETEVKARHGKVDPVLIDVEIAKQISGGVMVYTGLTSVVDLNVTGVLEVLNAADAETVLEQLKEDKLTKLNAAYNEVILTLGKGYPEQESASWPIQRDEYLKLRAGNTDTPWIDAAAANTGVTREVFADYIEANAKKFAKAHGCYTGQRHAQRDFIINSTLSDIAELVNSRPAFSLSEEVAV